MVYSEGDRNSRSTRNLTMVYEETDWNRWFGFICSSAALCDVPKRKRALTFEASLSFVRVTVTFGIVRMQ